jgi:transposase
MKDQETIARFVFLRAQGLSFARIASEINVSKPTLIQWSRQHQFEIHNLRAIETEALAEKFLAPRHDRWKQLGEQLRRIEEEIAKRNLDTVPTARLISLAAKLRAEVGREAGPPKFSTSVRSLPKEEYFEDVLDWQV